MSGKALLLYRDAIVGLIKTETFDIDMSKVFEELTSLN